MPDIAKLLSVGDLRSAGNSKKVVNLVLSQPKYFGEVVDAIFSDYPGTKMRASDAIEKISRICPELLRPYKKIFLNQVAKIEQKEVKWHTAQILPRLSLTKKEREKVYNLMISYLEDRSSIVRTFAMQALADVSMQDNSYLPGVKKLFNSLIKEGTPAMQSRGRKLLNLLK